MEFGELKGADGETARKSGEQKEIFIEADEAAEDDLAVWIERLGCCRMDCK